MKNNHAVTLLLLCALLINSDPILAHTDLTSKAGILANIMAVGLVVLSIIIFILVSSRKRKKTTKHKK